MKKFIIITAATLYLSSCSTIDSNSAKSKTTISESNSIELTCTPDKYGFQEYVSINTSTKTVIDNGAKSENALIEKGRIIYETINEGKKFIVRIDRTSGKMAVTEANNNSSSNKLDYICELIKPKF